MCGFKPERLSPGTEKVCSSHAEKKKLAGLDHSDYQIREPDDAIKKNN